MKNFYSGNIFLRRYFLLPRSELLSWLNYDKIQCLHCREMGIRGKRVLNLQCDIPTKEENKYHRTLFFCSNCGACYAEKEITYLVPNDTPYFTYYRNIDGELIISKACEEKNSLNL